MNSEIIVIAVVAAALLWVALNYNLLVKTRQHLRESWSNIDTELKRRYDLIPNLVETVKGYAAHERGLFARVAELRARAQASQGGPASQAADERNLVAGVRQLLALAESYPDLRASEHYLALQEQLVLAEDRIQRARRYFNANVRELNTRIEVFPSNLVARAFGFRQEEFFEVEEAVARRVVDVSFEG